MKTEGPYLEKFSYVYKIQNLKKMFMKMLIIDIKDEEILIKDTTIYIYVSMMCQK